MQSLIPMKSFMSVALILLGLNCAFASDLASDEAHIRAHYKGVEQALARRDAVGAMAGYNVFEKQGGNWKVVHEHTSTPMDLATGRAILDAPPRGPGQPFSDE